MQKHTPPPWKLTKSTTAGQFVTDTKIRDKRNAVIAVMHVGADENGNRIIECVQACEPFDNPTEAIPVMIGALKEFVSDVEAVGIEQVNSDWPDLSHSYKSARRALSLINKTK